MESAKLFWNLLLNLLDNLEPIDDITPIDPEPFEFWGDTKRIWP